MARDNSANDGDTNKSRLNRRNYLKLAGAAAASTTGYVVATAGAKSSEEPTSFGYGGKPLSESANRKRRVVQSTSASPDVGLVPVCTDRVDDEAKFRIENRAAWSVTVDYSTTEHERGEVSVGGSSTTELWVGAGADEDVVVELFHDGDRIARARNEGQSCEVQRATPVEIPDEILDDLTPIENPPDGPLGPDPTETPEPTTTTRTPTPEPTTTTETETPEPTETTTETSTSTTTRTETPTPTTSTETSTPEPTETTSTETPTPTSTTSTPSTTTTTELPDDFGELGYGEYGYGGVLP